jgi:hypothetical protein
MKAFKVFWKHGTTKKGYPGSAVIVAEDFDDCNRIAKQYGEVKSVATEDETVIWGQTLEFSASA